MSATSCVAQERRAYSLTRYSNFVVRPLLLWLCIAKVIAELMHIRPLLQWFISLDHLVLGLTTLRSSEWSCICAHIELVGCRLDAEWIFSWVAEPS